MFRFSTVFFVGAIICVFSAGVAAGKQNAKDAVEMVKQNLDNPKKLAELLPIVQCSFVPTKYEQVLATQLREVDTNTMQFRNAAEKVGELLVNKVVECLPMENIKIQTPVAACSGIKMSGNVELVSVMRSGDALLDTFMKHFPDANISKFLVQRNEETAEPHFKYMKNSATLASGNPVIITEPMIATGGTLEMVIHLLKEKGVKEENIIVASICTAPEGLVKLNQAFPRLKVVMTFLDQRLNEMKYIVPGLGDFGDRFYGTYKGAEPQVAVN